MHFGLSFLILYCLVAKVWTILRTNPTSHLSLVRHADTNKTIGLELFHELEELARIVDISYCVGVTGIWKPFTCISRCHEFPSFELVTSWNTGPLLSDSCGYIALDHDPTFPRIIVAFRGTYSIASTIADLSTIPQKYVPYPSGDPPNDESPTEHRSLSQKLLHYFRSSPRPTQPSSKSCDNCTVHFGFLASWQITRFIIMSHLTSAISTYPNYNLTLVGHSLGGAVALLAALEFAALGWNPKVTTFGEPKVGNGAFVEYVNDKLVHGNHPGNSVSWLQNALRNDGGTVVETRAPYCRVTHIDDPVPLLPLTEWGYRPHAGEIYISKPELAPLPQDVQFCHGNADPDCIAGTDDSSVVDERFGDRMDASRMLSPRYKLWKLFFAHSDYFSRLGLCVPGGSPWD